MGLSLVLGNVCRWMQDCSIAQILLCPFQQEVARAVMAPIPQDWGLMKSQGWYWLLGTKHLLCC